MSLLWKDEVGRVFIPDDRNRDVVEKKKWIVKGEERIQTWWLVEAETAEQAEEEVLFENTEDAVLATSTDDIYPHIAETVEATAFEMEGASWDYIKEEKKDA